MFQTTKTRKQDPKDHIWHYFPKRKLHKCVLCGALAAMPPAYPTDPEWLPDKYEALTQDERDLAPTQLAKKG